MAGKYGSLTEYIREYGRWGGRPPIPDWSDHQRGESRSLWLTIPLVVVELLLAGAPALIVLQQLPAPIPLKPLAAVGVLWLSGAGMLNQAFTLPLLDWYEDIPRRGLVDNAKPGVPDPEVIDP